MIRLIAAIDEKQGLATEAGIPWHLPGDVAYFRRRTEGGVVLMGRATYAEFAGPLENRRNVVLTTSTSTLRPGFERAGDPAGFFADHQADDVWVIGGAAVYASTIGRADELVLTQVLQDFQCTKFFPAYQEAFVRTDQSALQEEGGVAYRFETWRPKA